MSIEEISLGVGYENQSYFFRQFKSRYGVTPRAYMLDQFTECKNNVADFAAELGTQCELLENTERVCMLFTLQEKRINVKVNDTV